MNGAEIRVTTDANYVAVLLGFRYAYDHFKEAGGGCIVINASCGSHFHAAGLVFLSC